jgi:hypothetical protein
LARIAASWIGRILRSWARTAPPGNSPVCTLKYQLLGFFLIPDTVPPSALTVPARAFALPGRASMKKGILTSPFLPDLPLWMWNAVGVAMPFQRTA